MARLTANQWCSIRQAWEFCPDELSYTEAANRASEKHGFKAPSKVAVHKRVMAERWERRGSMAGINCAAHRIADRLGSEAEPKPGVQGGGTSTTIRVLARMAHLLNLKRGALLNSGGQKSGFAIGANGLKSQR